MRRERVGTRLAVALLAAVLIVLAPSSGSVLAHAELLEVVPGAGSVVPESPSGVKLRFSEPVSLVGGSVRLLDDEGSVVADDASVAGDTVTLPLPEALFDGTYTIAWEIISEDSHRISGASVFHVGVASATAPVAFDSPDDLPWSLRAGTTALLAVAYAAALLAVGLAWFAVAIARFGPDEGPRWRDVAGKAAIVGVVALLVALPARAARVGGGVDALGDSSFMAETLRGPIGVSTAITAIGLCVLIVLVVSRRAASPAMLVATGVLALAGFAIEGHTRTMEPRLLMAAFDVIHLVAGAIWLGGIVGLVIAFRQVEGTALATTVRRFSTAAVGTVVVVAAAGIGMSLIVLPSLSDLWSSSYGLVLIVKVSLVAIVVALGAFNQRRLVPAMDGGAAVSLGPGRDRLARIVRLELGVLLAVVAVTALLVGRSPTESEAASPPVAEAAAAPLTDGLGTVVVATPPEATGFFETGIALRDAAGQPLQPAAVPTVQLRESGQNLGPIDLEVHEVLAGGYHVFGDVPVPGTWELLVSVRVTDFDEATATLTTQIS